MPHPLPNCIDIHNEMITCYIHRIIFKTTNVRDSFAQNYVTLIDCLDCAELGIDKICIKH